jgi:TolB protein
LGLAAAVGGLAPASLQATEFTQITVAPATGSTWNSEPAWSPDGKSIAFTHAEIDRSKQFTSWIQVVAAAGGKPKPLQGQEAGEPPLLNSHPSWSPDGKRIVFASREGIYFSAERQTHPTVLAPGLHREGSPTWSPDGSWIAYESDASGIRTVWRVSSVGGEAEGFPTDRGGMSTPAWSPDSQRLACALWSSKGRDLWIVPLVGGVWRQVTRSESDDASPTWSPDGKLLAFVSDRSGNKDLWIVPSQGGEPVQLTQDPGDDIDPSWSPDGKSIAFASTRSGTLQIWIASDLPPASLFQRSWQPSKKMGH